MRSPSARTNRMRIPLAAAMLIAGTIVVFAQAGGSGGAGGGGVGGGGTGAGTAGTGAGPGGTGGTAGGAGVAPAPPPSPSRSPSTLNPSSPNTVPQQSYTPATPSTPGAATPNTGSGGSATSSGNTATGSQQGEPPKTTDRSRRTSSTKTRSVHHRWRHFAEPTLGSYYCGSSPCVRIYSPAVYRYPTLAYSASSLWWPGYYDYASGQWAHGRPRYGGYGRLSGYHGD